MSYQLVLCDDLYQEYHNFRNGISFDKAKIQKLLFLYKPPHLTNIGQLTRLNLVQHDASLSAQLISSGFNNQNLEALSKDTFYKIVLSSVDTNTYSGAFSLSSKLQNNYTFTYKIGEPRTEALEYIKILLSNSAALFIYDFYFADNWRSNINFFQTLMPHRAGINIFHNGHLDRIITPIKRIFNWNIQPDRTNSYYNNLHDRYLIIDNKIEIILTSGFSYLFDTDKEITVIVREKN
jgi:hypothetical protein